jgi:OOP family OmpA-OmpF porin
MKTLLNAALAAAMALGSTAALAQFYVGGGAGQSKVELDCSGTTSCDTKDTGYKGYVGYMFKPMWGVEASYTDFGKAKAGVDVLGTPVEVGFQPRAYSLFGVASTTFANRFSAFAKAGVAYVDSKATASVGSATLGDSDRATNLAFGLGVGVRVVEGFELRAEWERFRAEFVDEKGDVDFISMSVRLWLPK